MIRRTLAAVLTLSAAPAFAQSDQTLGLPSNCTAYVTMELADCTVSHYLTCAGDPEGQQYSVDLYPDGGDQITTLDSEAQWVATVNTFAGVFDTLGPDPVDPSLMSELLLSGKDSYDFTTVAADFTVTRFVGKERLTGQSATIDGVTLQEAFNEIRATDASGVELWRASGTEYVSQEWRIYMAGVTDWVTPTESYSSDSTPISFAFPGEPGFLSTYSTACNE